ncbi:MAG: hypothetical protein KC486_32110 [Myxococcales bacterium]|nr:hypothetical protein [Myxococcales bacterium]
MRFFRRDATHVRFEPDVDAGTTYAFRYGADRLVVGRRRMHRAIALADAEGGASLEELAAALVGHGRDHDAGYGELADLLRELLSLVDAEVLTTSTPTEAKATPTGHGSERPN